MPDPAVRPSFLLVHGAWHQSGCWTRLQAALTADGFHSRTVDLPSAGPAPSAGMYDDAEEIAAHLEQTEGPVIVVAHSYGGFPATQTAARPSLAHLVYLAAYMPAEGDSVGSIHGHPAGRGHELDGIAPVSFEDPREALYGDLPGHCAEYAMSQLIGQSRRSFGEQVTRATWRTVPSTYVLCERDQALRPALQAEMSVRATHVARLDAGHCPFLSAPAQLATLLGDISRAAEA
ncbi:MULTISPECIES: alpha/beta hydrolase [unclassified Streptomyces]|uniref:alpha/beta hydrolase n=1 Tax=unclassified Streptomyces TaxID=2593676 RepID=UPI0035E1B378